MTPIRVLLQRAHSLGVERPQVGSGGRLQEPAAGTPLALPRLEVAQRSWPGSELDLDRGQEIWKPGEWHSGQRAGGAEAWCREGGISVPV